MLRYRLDDLGWFQFEKIVQSLLKAELGLAVESWGGHKDLGRDAFSRTRLRFPDPSLVADGPFLFQAKFVQAANAAGASWRALLIKAVSNEMSEIARRKSFAAWESPKHYILLTNCPLTTAAREELAKELALQLPTTTVTTLGGTDICDLLDKHPELRRAFPEILSLRDLDLLLAESVSKPILERSRAALAETRDLVPVFVPTRAYQKAWRSLKKHRFAVLDGPPEMGKTAIARTIALAHLLNNWEAVDCRNPADFFSVFSDQRRQIFVADDAFGRTEFDPALGRMWERDLPRVFQLLDSRHRLIWTTRKHILVRAVREMDLTGKASRFPDPGEVVVTADELSIEERARILYQHSRSAGLSAEQRDVIRNHAPEIVRNAHFTPERIRRLVRETLPDVISGRGGTPASAEEIYQEVNEAIRNPTARMRKAFRKLPPMHTWVLISFLECNRGVQSDVLRARFGALQPDVPEVAFTEALDDLIGSFLKLGYGQSAWGGRGIDWIHPSYRDLVIDELASNPEKQVPFLRRVSVSGVKLALSLGGGSSGERQMPLVRKENNWAALTRRCQELAVSEEAHTVAELLDVLTNAATAEGVPTEAVAHINRILRAVCEATVERWDSHEEPLATQSLKSFHRACELLVPPPRLPDIGLSWHTACENLRDAIRLGFVSDISQIVSWGGLLDLIEKHYTSLSETAEFHAIRSEIETGLFAIADADARAEARFEEPAENRAEGRRLEAFAEALTLLDHDGTRDGEISQLFGIAERYKERGAREEEPDYEPDDYDSLAAKPFDVKALFEDL